MSDHVTIVEVGARDGLQNEPAKVPPAQRLALIERLTAAGLPVIEAGAFVSPKWVPQMAGTDEILAGLNLGDATRYPVLVPNMRGMEAALAGGAREIAVFAAASGSFSQKNINCSIDESLARFAPVAEAARANSVRLRGYVSCVLGCPYEGAVDPAAVLRVSRALLDMGCTEISLGDTIGVGTPRPMRALLDLLTQEIPVGQLAVHCHDTYGQALANVITALEVGVRTVDASVAGLGGCPYAKGASGNLATEDLLFMLHGSGFETGVDLDAIVEAGAWISDLLGRAPVSKAAAALAARG